MDERTAGWDEHDSHDFIDLGRFFVPDREEQVAAVLDMVPDPGDGLLVDLCCGEGLLSRALLERFPRARVLAMDLSPAMLEHARAALAAYGERFTARQFDLGDRSWRSFPEPVRAFVSSLAVHHLDGAGKRELFLDLAAALAPGGAVVIADLVKPATPASHQIAARAWDGAVRRRSLELAGHLGPYEKFRRALEPLCRSRAGSDRSAVPPSRPAPLARGGRPDRRRRLLAEGRPRRIRRHPLAWRVDLAAWA